MLKIFICEDDKIEKERLEKIIKNILIIENYDMDIELSTNDPFKIIDYLKSISVSGLYFLDVNLHSKINGIQLAEKIREFDPRGFIVFITTHAEMSYLTFLYKVEAMDYIIKDNYNNVAQRIRDCIINSNSRYTCKSPTIQEVFSIRVNDKIINVDFNDIIFFETSSTIHKITLHSTSRLIEFYGKMKEVENMLSDNFCRCHNSFIINKNKIKEIDKKNRIVYMINDEECLISTRGIKKLLSK
ncbi:MULTISPECIES: LytTR family DNA-binding domain-containing protein [Clostridium]|uniref:Stage 0 sporulation protein A homolog n=1 Tax=Clostridium cibarium TaxID=2762247 RepID=A0ABR8PSL7_9CLOT|nr:MULTISPECIES: LytTR family DNA-binding domain-containing protein [Clostridium]MBD7911171.1 response regulator transcription factor [Clostridium cibarium]